MMLSHVSPSAERTERHATQEYNNQSDYVGLRARPASTVLESHHSKLKVLKQFVIPAASERYSNPQVCYRAATLRLSIVRRQFKHL